ncbi:uncharacterized protein ZBIST_2932 [Zygosaccharomyces bailii]|nr:uncharacterized protein ZBIST_2932 [Zygosaccharomyces bailii]
MKKSKSLGIMIVEPYSALLLSRHNGRSRLRNRQQIVDNSSNSVGNSSSSRQQRLQSAPSRYGREEILWPFAQKKNRSRFGSLPGAKRSRASHHNGGSRGVVPWVSLSGVSP